MAKTRTKTITRSAELECSHLKRGHYSRGDIIQRGTLFKEIRYFLRKKILHVCLIRDYCLLQKIPCIFIYFWTFIPCCMLIRDSWLFGTLEYIHNNYYDYTFVILVTLALLNLLQIL